MSQVIDSRHKQERDEKENHKLHRMLSSFGQSTEHCNLGFTYQLRYMHGTTVAVKPGERDVIKPQKRALV